MCVAKLGTTCPDAADPSADAIFVTLANPLKITHVFRVLQGALPKDYTITQVSHNGTTMPTATTCAHETERLRRLDRPVNARGRRSG